jgi:intracellular multiplication protein IcmE
VDHHYLERYGAIMAASFLTGYSSAITQAGQSTTGVFGTSATHPALSPGNKIAVGLGQIGTNLSAMMQSKVNKPATVQVNSGVGLGILFVSDVAE